VKFTLKHFAVLCFAASLATPVFAQSGGADVYKAKCAMCHGPDGLSNTPAGKAMKAASFKDPALIKASDGELFAGIANGKGKMPAYKGKLSDEQIKGVVGYIRVLQR
jgi:mono/diheme cytochrome c family protein